MKQAYQTVDRKDSRALARFRSREGQALLPILDLIEQAEMGGAYFSVFSHPPHGFEAGRARVERGMPADAQPTKYESPVGATRTEFSAGTGGSQAVITSVALPDATARAETDRQIHRCSRPRVPA